MTHDESPTPSTTGPRVRVAAAALLTAAAAAGAASALASASPQPRIVGGTTAATGEFPSLVSIGTKGETSQRTTAAARSSPRPGS